MTVCTLPDLNRTVLKRKVLSFSYVLVASKTKYSLIREKYASFIRGMGVVTIQTPSLLERLMDIALSKLISDWMTAYAEFRRGIFKQPCEFRSVGLVTVATVSFYKGPMDIALEEVFRSLLMTSRAKLFLWSLKFRFPLGWVMLCVTIEAFAFFERLMHRS